MAPSAAHRAILSVVPAVTREIPPASRTSWIAAVPTPLPPAWIRTVSPERRRATLNRFWYAVRNTSGIAAACSKERVFGDPHRQPRRDGHELRVPAPRQQGAHPVPRRPSLACGPDVDHLSGHLEPEDVRDALGRRVLSPPLQQVGAVERRRPDPDEEFVLLHDGIGVLPDVEDLDAAHPAHQHRVHVRASGDVVRFKAPAAS